MKFYIFSRLGLFVGSTDSGKAYFIDDYTKRPYKRQIYRSSKGDFVIISGRRCYLKYYKA